jgi:hypothetical protein
VETASNQRSPSWNWLREWSAAGWNTLRMPGKSHRGPLPPADDHLRQRAADLRRHVTHLAEEIGERHVPGRPEALNAAAEYVEAQWAMAGCEVKYQPYEVAGTICRNLEVELPGTRHPEEIVVVGAHYDSVPGSPAANDNGSGTAALLCLARELFHAPLDRTLRLVAFVNEESPYGHTEQMGSWVYAHRCRQRGEKVTAMLSLETIGYYSDVPGSQQYPPWIRLLYPSRGNFIGFIGSTRYARLVRQVAEVFRKREPFPSEAAALPERLSHITRSDHWSFWRHDYPALMVTDTAPFRYHLYHTAEDTVDKLDFDRTARVVRGLESVIAALLSTREDER